MANSQNSNGLVPHSDASVHDIQDKMAELGYVVPVRVISEAMLYAMDKSKGDTNGK